MASLVPACRVFSEALDVPVERLLLIGRTLRESAGQLLPRDLHGGRPTHLRPEHFLNLLIAVAAADPITKAPSLVQSYREAVYVVPMDVILPGAGRRKEPPQPILPGVTFGSDLGSLIDFLAVPSPEATLCRGEFNSDFLVTLTVGDAGTATVERPSQNRIDQYDSRTYEEPSDTRTFGLNGDMRRVIPLMRIVRLDFFYFEVAAALWADSLACGATRTIAYDPIVVDR